MNTSPHIRPISILQLFTYNTNSSLSTIRFAIQDYDLEYACTSPVGRGAGARIQPAERQFTAEQIKGDSNRDAFFVMSDKVTTQTGWNRFVV
jgi:hypothetical protein